MSDNEIVLALDKREVLGKGLNQLRKQNIVPAVIHDHGKPSLHVMGEYRLIAKVYGEAGKHHPVNLKIGDKSETVIIKDVHYDPVKHVIRHVVFQAIRQDETVETEVPVVLEGEIPAVKAGLMVITHLTHVNAEALPRDLPDQLVVDATGLAEINDKITVADITVPSGVTILTEPETLIASVEETKAQLSEESTEEEVEGEGEETEESEQEEKKEGTEE